MYDELVKQLHQRIALTTAGSPLQDDLREAADAIEKLSAYVALYKDCTETAVKTAGNLCKTAKRLSEKVPRWIPVTERLPDFEGSVLCMRKSYIHPGMRHQEIMYVDEHGFSNADDVYAEAGNVTHWMPLPAPPEEDSPIIAKASPASLGIRKKPEED